MITTRSIISRRSLALLIGWPLLFNTLTAPPVDAQADSTRTGTSTVEMVAVRREFAHKDATIAALRQELAARVAEIAVLRHQLSTQVPSQIALPPDTAQSAKTIGAGTSPLARTRPAHGPSVVGMGAIRLYATDLAVTDGSAAFADTPWDGKTLANAGNEHYMLFDAQKAGDYLTFAFSVSQSGKYTMETSQYCTGGQGQYHVEVDGIAVGQMVDFGDNNQRVKITTLLMAGEHTLTYRSDGTASDAARYGVKSIEARIYCMDFAPVM